MIIQNIHGHVIIQNENEDACQICLSKPGEREREPALSIVVLINVSRTPPSSKKKNIHAHCGENARIDGRRDWHNLLFVECQFDVEGIQEAHTTKTATFFFKMPDINLPWTRIVHTWHQRFYQGLDIPG